MDVKQKTQSETVNEARYTKLDWQAIKTRIQDGLLKFEAKGQLSSEEVQSILRKRAKHLASSKTEVREEKHFNLLLFHLRDESYLLELKWIKEVALLNTRTMIPGSSVFITGFMNLRGQIVPLVDLRKLFSLSHQEDASMNQVVILQHQDKLMGILAERVEGTLYLDLENEQKSVPTLQGINEKYLLALTKRQQIVLDGRKILDEMSLVPNN